MVRPSDVHRWLRTTDRNVCSKCVHLLPLALHESSLRAHLANYLKREVAQSVSYVYCGQSQNLMGASPSAEDAGGTIEERGAASFTTEDRLRRLELSGKREEAVMEKLRNQVDRIEQFQAEMRITQETLLLRLTGKWDVPAEEDDGWDSEQDDFYHVYMHLNLLRAAQAQLGLELIKAHKQETYYIAEYAKLKHRIQRLEESLVK